MQSHAAIGFRTVCCLAVVVNMCCCKLSVVDWYSMMPALVLCRLDLDPTSNTVLPVLVH